MTKERKIPLATIDAEDAPDPVSAQCAIHKRQLGGLALPTGIMFSLFFLSKRRREAATTAHSKIKNSSARPDTRHCNA